MSLDPVHYHPLLRRAHEVALRAKSLGRHPFGALLVAPDGVTVLAEQGNIVYGATEADSPDWWISWSSPTRGSGEARSGSVAVADHPLVGK